MLIDVLGWTAAAFAACVALPQVLRILRSGTTAGVSTFAWQLAISANLSWVSHGVLTAHPNVWLPNWRRHRKPAASSTEQLGS